MSTVIVLIILLVLFVSFLVMAHGQLRTERRLALAPGLAARFSVAHHLTRSPTITDAPRARATLVRLLNDHGTVIVELDGTVGYSSSFLLATFGGLPAACGLPASVVQERLQLVSRDASLVQEIRERIDGVQLTAGRW